MRLLKASVELQRKKFLKRLGVKNLSELPESSYVKTKFIEHFASRPSGYLKDKDYNIFLEYTQNRPKEEREFDQIALDELNSHKKPEVKPKQHKFSEYQQDIY